MINTEYIQAILDGDKERLEELRNPPKTKLCHHFHRVHLSMEEGINNNCPEEEFRVRTIFYEFPSRIETSYWFERKESLLHKISDTKCVCSKCSREFPIENMDKMARLFERMNELTNLGADSKVYFFDLEILNLYRNLEPTWYQEDYKNNVTVLSAETDPSKWEEPSVCYKWNLVSGFARNYPVLQLPEISGKNRYTCKHYDGNPTGVVTYEMSTEEDKFFFPQFGGGVESLLFTNPYGVCKCRKCRRVFSPEEQEKMERLITYMNTPHYYDKESFSHHKEWLPIFDFYDKDYRAENEPYQMLSSKKILELSQGIEPVVYRETHKKSKAEVLQTLRWDGKEWRA